MIFDHMVFIRIMTSPMRQCGNYFQQNCAECGYWRKDFLGNLKQYCLNCFQWTHSGGKFVSYPNEMANGTKVNGSYREKCQISGCKSFVRNYEFCKRHRMTVFQVKKDKKFLLSDDLFVDDRSLFRGTLGDVAIMACAAFGIELIPYKITRSLKVANAKSLKVRHN